MNKNCTYQVNYLAQLWEMKQTHSKMFYQISTYIKLSQKKYPIFNIILQIDILILVLCLISFPVRNIYLFIFKHSSTSKGVRKTYVNHKF